MRKIRIFIFTFIVVLIGILSINIKVGASGLIDYEFKGQVNYNINLSNYYYLYVFPFVNQNEKFLSLSDNNGVNIDIITYNNDRLYHNGTTIDSTHASNYIYAFVVDLANLGNNNYRYVMFMYRLYVNENIGSWESVKIGSSYTLNIDFTTNYIDNVYLILNNNIIYIGPYSGAIEGVSTINSIFTNYLLGSSNSLGKYMNHIKDRYYNSGYSDGLGSGSNIINTFLSPMFTWIDNFLSIQIGPNLSIGNILLIPLMFGVLGLILYFWRKD